MADLDQNRNSRINAAGINNNINDARDIEDAKEKKEKSSGNDFLLSIPTSKTTIGQVEFEEQPVPELKIEQYESTESNSSSRADRSLFFSGA